MKVFYSDLDNTLIYSYKHDIGKEKVCVEICQGREISFMTKKSFTLLKEVSDKFLFIPVTTRTYEQYSRIHLGAENSEYALVCNGGVLLVNGEEDLKWYEESLRLTAESRGELARAKAHLDKDEYRSFELRNIRDLFLFTKSKEPDKTVQKLKTVLDAEKVRVFKNGVKVYVMPVSLTKGSALRRLNRRLNADYVIAAGDSEFDVSMLREADMAIAPKSLAETYDITGNVIKSEGVLSDEALNCIMKI